MPWLHQKVAKSVAGTFSLAVFFPISWPVSTNPPGSPKTWDREMVARCGDNARAEPWKEAMSVLSMGLRHRLDQKISTNLLSEALHGRACEFVEPYVPLMKKHSAINKEKAACSLLRLFVKLLCCAQVLTRL